MSDAGTPIEIFCSYAPEDKIWFRELEAHLSLLKRQGLIFAWHDRLLLPGANWAQNIDSHLNSASIILLLISADYLTSDSRYEVEMKRALERQSLNEACVIPILVRPVDWENAPFKHLSVLPTNAEPITSWPNRDEAWKNVVQGIKAALSDVRQHLTVGTPTAALTTRLNIPFPPNPFFTGQEALLEQLARTLKTGQSTTLSQPQAISGLGGIGKTQIAVEYAYRHRQDYQTIFWVRADTHEALVSGYVTIAGMLNLSEKDEKDQTIIVQAVGQWLKTHREWLLIFDNADDLAIVREFIPTVFGGHILLTTRAQSMGRLAQRIEVDTMKLDTGALLLLRRVGLIAQNASLDTASSADVAIGREICKELGGLPLALDQAGAFIEEVQCSLLDYQQRYRTRRTLLLKRRGGVVADHPEPVATTWSLSFEKVEQRSPIAADLLRLCAFLHPDAIPVELIMQGASHLGPSLATVAENDVALDEAIATLGAYSLIHRNMKERMLSIHRLVQTVLQDALTTEAEKLWTQRAVTTLNAVFPDVIYEVWGQCERLISHVLLYASVTMDQANDQELAALLKKAADYLYRRAQYDQAEPLYQRALAIRERVLGAFHPDTAETLHNLARLYQDQGRYDQAEPLYQRALAIREQALGSSDPQTARTLHNLAQLYQDQGQYDQAKTLYQRALTIYEQALGASNLQTARTLYYLAQLYQDQGKYIEAEPFYQRALAVQEQALGAEHPNTADTLHDLARLYQDRGQYDLA
ncbi:MAG TPA: FxSxx-COOH system tetratricopeptide repeat protein, partial [Ktedonobacteraceae bacterium]|nr:FxSxx-COOH system tetratricopeptide repeat protein [Ktedonobacteraceae bacterium]